MGFRTCANPRQLCPDPRGNSHTFVYNFLRAHHFWGTSLLGATSTFGAKFKATDRQPFSLLKLQQNRHRQFLLLYDPDGSGVGCDLQADVDRVVFRIKEQETQHTPQGRSLAKTGTT